MVIDIKMCRFDNVPWGFRLVGGSDFEFPLTVVKISEGSIAEEAGLKIGDVVVRINDTAATPLAHEEVNQLIKHCGNVFYFGVYRENPEADNSPKQFPIVGLERPSTPDSFLAVRSSSIEPLPLSPCKDFISAEYLPDLDDRPCSVLSENSEIKLVEEEIAAVLSGESEVLKDHDIMGIFPKPGVCMSSEVLKTLNDEATKTKAEKDKENKKWTTFLQKPNRPIPKSPAQIEAERRAAAAYKVKIVKSAPKATESPVPPVVPVEVVPLPEPIKEDTLAEPEVEVPPPTDSEVPNLEDIQSEEFIAENDAEECTDEEKGDKEKEASPERKETEEQDNKQHEETIGNESSLSPPCIPSPKKTEEELALERQLADVQKQLAALSSLPSTIQTTLDAVTKQLAELLPTFKLHQMPAKKGDPEEREISLEKIRETPEEAKEDDTATANGDGVENERPDNKELATSKQLNINATDMSDSVVEAHEMHEMEVLPNSKEQEEVRQMEEEQNVKKHKSHDVIEELEEHLERKNNPKRSKRAFGPLTPSSERPLVLPGGRRWYRPKDAYNDEFIAETLSAQAELITGTTLGVNFMKYQKPEKKIDLNRSEVYKVIHHLDRQPVRGIEIRPPVVPAEVDIRNAVPS